MSEHRPRRRLPFALIAMALLLGGYVSAYFMLSDVVQRSRTSTRQSRIFTSEAAHRAFRPLTWIESRFDQDRGFSHRGQ
jgi:hypothetical protein